MKRETYTRNLERTLRIMGKALKDYGWAAAALLLFLAALMFMTVSCDLTDRWEHPMELHMAMYMTARYLAVCAETAAALAGALIIVLPFVLKPERQHKEKR